MISYSSHETKFRASQIFAPHGEDMTLGLLLESICMGVNSLGAPEGFQNSSSRDFNHHFQFKRLWLFSHSRIAV